MLIHQNNPHGGDIYRNRVRYDFSANVSPLGTPEAVKDAVRNAAGNICAYPDPYCEDLRKALSIHEGLNAEQIICGNGAADLIFSFAAACRPEKAMIISPTFCEYEQSLVAAGSAIEYYDLPEKNDFTLDDRILDVISEQKYDAIYLCNPNNPTGKLCEKNLLRKIAALCFDRECRLFIDECFMDMAGDPADPANGDGLTLTGETAENPFLFILKAFTKSYGMAGVRLGYAMCSDNKLLQKMSERTQSWNVSTVAQAAGIAALGCGSYLNLVREVVAAERTYLTESLRRLGYRVFDGTANFLLFKAEEGLFGRLLEKGILIRKCGNFRGLDNRFYRAAVKAHDENIAFIKAMEEIANG